MKNDPPEPHPFERFTQAVKQILSVPKDVVVAKEKALHQERSRVRKKRAKAAG